MKGLGAVLLVALALLAAAPATARAICGDGVLEDGEGCDDGGREAGDGCDADCAVELGFACDEGVRLGRITAEDYPGSSPPASWDVAADGLSAVQTVNGNASVGLFGADAMARTWVFDVTVETTDDDDWFGFVLGFAPGDTTNDAADFLLLDWKQATQAGWSAGLVLSRVRGVPDQSTGAPGTDLWNHNGAVSVIARADGLGDVGWVDLRTYRFEIAYTPSRLVVRVDGAVEIDLAPPSGESWPAGEIGFYGFSQADVRYAIDPPPPTPCGPDGDGDGIFDARDADDDGDGVPDRLEVMGFAGDPDADGDDDGVPDWEDPDVVACADAGGRCATLPAAIDPDGDGLPSHRDRDADGDGVPDGLEAGHGAPLGADGALADGSDGDGDGLADAVDRAPGDPGDAGAAFVLADADGAGAPDLFALDADGDGLGEAIEAHDDDGDGVAERGPVGADHDGDGLDDAFDADCAGAPAPCAADGVPVRAPYDAARDADGDGEPD